MISVIIPMYNSENTIIKCINSVLSQSRIDLIKEIIVVNDGSSDNSYNKVMDAYKDNKLVHVLSQNNSGVSAARNKGIRNATGEWIAFLDSDDVWYEKKLEVQYEIIKKNKNIKCIGTGIKPGNSTPGKKISGNLYCMTVRDLLIKYWPLTSSLLIYKEELENVEMFDEERMFVEDGQLMLKLARRSPLYYVSDILVECGHGKPRFGASGLSGNLLGMHEGCLQNVEECYERKDINKIECSIYKIYEKIKYIRRLVIVNLRKIVSE